jgi:hypothetical protein
VPWRKPSGIVSTMTPPQSPSGEPHVDLLGADGSRTAQTLQRRRRYTRSDHPRRGPCDRIRTVMADSWRPRPRTGSPSGTCNRLRRNIFRTRLASNTLGLATRTWSRIWRVASANRRPGLRARRRRQSGPAVATGEPTRSTIMLGVGTDSWNSGAARYTGATAEPVPLRPEWTPPIRN